MPTGPREKHAQEDAQKHAKRAIHSDASWPRLFTSAIGASAFQEINLGVTIWTREGPRGIFGLSDTVLGFEVEHRSELSRWEYNGRCMERARRESMPILGEHKGFHDLFLRVGDNPDVVLVAGPFSIKWPTSADLSERWREVARARASLADPSFSRYLTATLNTLVLEGKLFGIFEQFLVCFSNVLSGRGDPETLGKKLDALKIELLAARAPERAWVSAHSMLHDRSAGQWLTDIARDPLQRLRMKRPPRHVLVALLRSRKTEDDPIDEALRRHAFQREIVSLAYEHGDLVCGQVGDHGVSLVAAFATNGARARAQFVELTRLLAEPAKRFGFRLHCGVALAAGSEPLPARYRMALAAADTALARGVTHVFAPDHPEAAARSLAELRAQLAESVDDRAVSVLARFERYVEAVVTHAGYQFDATRAHLEAGLDRLAEPLLASGQLDRKGFLQLSAPLQSGPEGAPSTLVLIGAYRGVVAEIERIIQEPTQARQHRGTGRALAFMREHLGDNLSLAQVSRVAGFAPDYFSRLLKREEGLGFEGCLQRMRLERAKHMLTTTPLHVGRIAQLTGFKGRAYFQQVFKRYTGVTPIQHRVRTQPGARAS